MLGSGGNALYYGDNLAVLRENIATESVDLVYLDPPFNSQATYNLLFKPPSGAGSQAQIEAFEDTWHWGHEAEDAFDQVMRSGNTDAADMLRAVRSFLGDNDMMAYLAMMAVRMIELHRALRPTGSLYLHCDPTASHYLRILLDAIFGRDRFQGNRLKEQRSNLAHRSLSIKAIPTRGRRGLGPLRNHSVLHYVFHVRRAARFCCLIISAPVQAIPWDRFLNELIWKRSSAHTAKRFAPVHDTIFFYSKGPQYVWNQARQPTDPARDHRRLVKQRRGRNSASLQSGGPDGRGRAYRPIGSGVAWHRRNGQGTPLGNPRLCEADGEQHVRGPGGIRRARAPSLAEGGRRNADAETLYRGKSGIAALDVITDIAPLNNAARERLGYPTQKPLSLLGRLISASSNPGGVVLDPFCGCGTAVHAAQKLGRAWIGVDVTHLAISLIERRLKDAFPGIAFEVHGAPKDLDGARDLAIRDKYQFQWWAVSLIDAQPFAGKKKGADGGIDGIIYFRSDTRTTERAIVSVKGGGIGVPMVRDLKGVLDREKAPIGVFLTLLPPTRPMETEAAAAGFYTPGERRYPRLQIITIEQALGGMKPAIPLIDTGAAFRRATREETTIQPKLNI